MTRDKILEAARRSGLRFLSVTDLMKIAEIGSDNTAYRTAQRLVAHGLLKRLRKDLYVPVFSSPTDFEIANHLYAPSYVSLESALSFYGIIPEFTYGITSVTTKKTRKISVGQKPFEYVHLSNRYFSDYVRTENFWIATPEKALIDMCYMVSKGLRELDFDRLERRKISRKKFHEIASRVRHIAFRKMLKEIRI